MANNKTHWTAEDPPNLLLSVDPGASWPGQQIKHPYAGCALFQWGTLVWVGLVRCPTVWLGEHVGPYAMPNLLVRRVCEEANVARHAGDRGESLTVFACEKPVLRKRSPARPTDILDLRGIWGALMGGIDAEFYSAPSPEEHKGSIADEVYRQNIWGVLNAGEKVIVADARHAGRCGPPSQHSHVDAAYGLGLFVLGRCGKAGIV